MPVDSKRDGLFVAFTPYNVFTSAILASQSPSTVNDLVLIEDFAGADCLIECLREWRDSPFRKIVNLPGVNSSQSLPERVLRLAINSRRVAGLVKRSDYGRVFVCNERRPESQAAIAVAKSLNDETRGFTIEDGLNSYRFSTFEINDGPLNVWLKHRIYGSWFEDVSFAGGFSQTDSFLCWYPDVYGQKAQNPYFEASGLPNCEPIKIRNQTRESLSQLAIAMTNRIGLPAEQLRGLRTILFLPKMTWQTSDSQWMRLIDDCCKQHTKTGQLLGIKYHPRDAADDPFEIRGRTNAVEIPNLLPAEFIFIQSNKTLDLVLGGATTSLMTARCVGGIESVYCVEQPESVEASLAISALGIRNLNELTTVFTPLSDCESVLAPLLPGVSAA